MLVHFDSVSQHVVRGPLPIREYKLYVVYSPAQSYFNRSHFVTKLIVLELPVSENSVVGIVTRLYDGCGWTLKFYIFERVHTGSGAVHGLWVLFSRG
jgi:hypothetical protein